MLSSPEEILKQVEIASTPEDLFGPLTQEDKALRSAKRLRRIYANHVHPDRAGAYGVAVIRATEAFAKLDLFYERWSRGCASKTRTPAWRAMDSSKIILASESCGYVLGKLIAEGSVANMYSAESVLGRVAVKMPRHVSSSKFIDAERTALTELQAMVARGNDWLEPYYPRLLDTITHRTEGTLEQRKINVLDDLSREAGFFTLAEVKTAIPDGLDGRDWAWIHRRLLAAIAGAHLAGIVHGAILPGNVLIHPEGHGVVLAGWSFAARPGGRPEGRVHSQRDFYPPEAAAGAVVAESDVYMAHALMLWMLAPGERRQRTFAEGCMQAGARMRPDAASLLQEYDELLEDLYGKRTFRVFPYIPHAAQETA